MVNRVVQIRIGRANSLDTGDADCDCSITLVQIASTNILVDTGGAWAGAELVQSIGDRAGLESKDISLVVCTHGHSDHVGCLALFPNATHIVGRDINLREKYFSTNLRPQDQSINKCIATVDAHGKLKITAPFMNDVVLQVITTPGHTGSCVSVLVQSNEEIVFEYNDGACATMNKVAIVGDLWECENDDDFWPDYSEMSTLQRQSRSFVLKWKPDVIVPGHGPAFTPVE
ncbi:hypothetical protein THRCLA_01581 [Thraustotheca clavata]|uniref:Metallo-beta-lactamase domain-containing protein 1 n=1 Tax=Thraustotheca clavata TaxID=74557 RepID=A0A1W0A8P2_9STRA|nr:hypothetical protein THRCLA_01581 [Thraustotheca clavata]